jgi:hypothetical protein
LLAWGSGSEQGKQLNAGYHAAVADVGDSTSSPRQIRNELPKERSRGFVRLRRKGVRARTLTSREKGGKCVSREEPDPRKGIGDRHVSRVVQDSAGNWFNKNLAAAMSARRPTLQRTSSAQQPVEPGRPTPFADP